MSSPIYSKTDGLLNIYLSDPKDAPSSVYFEFDTLKNAKNGTELIEMASICTDMRKNKQISKEDAASALNIFKSSINISEAKGIVCGFTAKWTDCVGDPIKSGSELLSRLLALLPQRSSKTRDIKVTYYTI